MCGRLRWSLWKDLSASVFFNVHIVSKTQAEFSAPISAFMELLSNANLPCLVNLAQSVCRVRGIGRASLSQYKAATHLFSKYNKYYFIIAYYFIM